MRVLHVQKVKGIGGSERHLLQLLPGLGTRDVDVAMCILGTGEYSRFVEPLRMSGIEATVLDADRLSVARLMWGLAGEIRRYRPDVVHTHLIHADILGQVAARVSRVPAVSSIHSTHSFYRRQPVLTAARVAGHLARRTIAISNHVARFVTTLRLARRGSVDVIPYGIDVRAWSGDEVARSAAREALGVPERAIIVAVASRLIPGKGHDTLLDAHRRALAQVPDLVLAIAGEGPLRPDLEARARSMGASVRFLGFVDDVPALLRASDVVAFPTQPELSEGFGLAALEAMAAGRPVVATDVGPLPELVLGAGIVVEARSTTELAAALVRLARDGELRKTLGEEGRLRASSDYSLDAMVDRTREVYREVA